MAELTKDVVASTPSNREAGIKGAPMTEQMREKQSLEAKIPIFINGKEYQVAQSMSIFEACQANRIHVPTLCHHPRLKPAGKCRVCVVEVAEPEQDSSSLKLACSTRVSPGLRIVTNSPIVRNGAAKALYTFTQTNLPQPKVKIASFKNQEIEELLKWQETALVDESSWALTRDMSACVGCSRCLRACMQLQDMNILLANTKPGPCITTPEDLPIADTECISCGQCALFCPTGAITERDDTEIVRQMIRSGKIVILQTAPATRVAVAECFGCRAGTNAEAQMVEAARKLGFKYVFDTNFGADLTIMEEGYEFLKRVKQGGPFPQFTSCCPGWINMVEKKYPQFIPNLSTARSPHMMLGSICKTYFAKQINVPPQDIFVVSLMPCIAKKDEMNRPQQIVEPGIKSVDCVISTREFGRMVQQAGINWNGLCGSPYDNPLGESTGAAAIFGVTGGVMEAALRTAYEVHTSKTLPKLEFDGCRGLEGTKESVLDLDGTEIRICVANGSRNVQNLLQRVASGEAKYHFIEIMACPGGCIGGGGQPLSYDPDVLQKRSKAIYDIDTNSKLRKSHENPSVVRLYKEFLGEPLSHLSHKLLHTHYTDRKRRSKVGKSALLAGPTAGPSSDKSVLVLWGSQGGTAHTAAEKLHGQILSRKPSSIPATDIRLASMGTYSVANLAKEKKVVLICSTFADGEFPDPAVPFWDALQGMAPDALKGVEFAVFGLGSSSYQSHFCEAGHKLDDQFEKLGGQRLVQRGEGDEQAVGKYDTAFEPWCKSLFNVLGLTGESVNEPHPPKYIVSMALNPVRFDDETRPCPPGFHYVRLSESKLLTPPGYEREARFLSFDLTGSGLSYATGDHAGFLPRNPRRETREFLKLFGLNPETPINVALAQPGGKKAKLDLPPILTVGELFEQYVDLFGQISKTFLKELVLFASYKSDKDELNRLLDDKNQRDFELFVKENTYADALIKFRKSIPPLGNLISIVPFIKPRLYSIASSGLVHPNQLEHIIVLNQWRTPSGKIKTGLCTQYLWGLNPEDTPMVACTIHTGILQPPTNPEHPILCVGLGTGIAPFRSFLQERELLMKQGVKVGPCDLFLGCRYKTKDWLCREELDAYLEKKVLNSVNMAFSHDQAYFIFVQDKMREDPHLVWDICKAENLHMYYCGPAMGIPQQVFTGVEEAIKWGLEHPDAPPVDQSLRTPSANVAVFKSKDVKTITDKLKANYHVECF